MGSKLANGQVLEKLPKSQKAKFEIATMKDYKRALVYLRERFDFKPFKCLILQKEVNFE
jgi:hypothetical protein